MPPLIVEDFTATDVALVVARPRRPGPFFKPALIVPQPVVPFVVFSVNFLMKGLGKFASSAMSYTGGGGRASGFHVGMLVGAVAACWTTGRIAELTVDLLRRRALGSVSE